MNFFDIQRTKKYLNYRDPANKILFGKYDLTFTPSYCATGYCTNWRFHSSDLSGGWWFLKYV